MSAADAVISIRGLAKRYRLGATGTGTFAGDVQRWIERRVLGRGEAEADGPDTFWVLEDLDLDVRRGEILGIIGKNGAGKSTLLKIITKVTLPTRGEVRLRGRVASLLEVGTGFHPELTGRENVFLNGSILGMTSAEIEAKFQEIVEFSGVGRFIDTPVKRYSSGMYVRLAFAVAAHLEPEILLVDEVLAVGDSEFQKKCLGKMNDVADAGRTILFVSHNMAAIRSLCTRAIVLEEGRIAFDGPPREALARYLSHGTDARAAIGAEALRAMADEAKPGRKRYFHCLAMRVADVSGAVRSSFSSHEDVVLEIEYEILEPVPMFNIVVTLTAAEDEYVLRTERLDALGPDQTDALAPGRYVSRCVLRADTFAERRYHVTANLQYHGVENIPYRHAVSFDVSFHGYNHATMTQPSRMAALTRPLLPWTTTPAEGPAPQAPTIQQGQAT